VSGPYHTVASGTCANACSTVCTTFELVHVMVGTSECAPALVRRLVLMYTTWSELEVADASVRYLGSGEGGHGARHQQHHGVLIICEHDACAFLLLPPGGSAAYQATERSVWSMQCTAEQLTVCVHNKPSCCIWMCKAV
jgi:hypothetical protein